jgi:DOPA 4,5-dioxygenase
VIGCAHGYSNQGPEIKDWHAHVYFDPATRDVAWALRERIEKAFDIVMGASTRSRSARIRCSATRSTSRIAVRAADLWLTLNHGDLTVFIHPNTGQDLEDHRDRALWIGRRCRWC